MENIVCTHFIQNRVITEKHRHSEGNEDIESRSYMYDACNNPTTTYLEVDDCVESSVSDRFNSSSKFKRRFYNTRHLRFGWTNRPPRESQQQHKHKYFRRNKGHSLTRTDHHPQSADNHRPRIVRNRPKDFKKTSSGAHNPLIVASPVKKTAGKVGKTTAAKAKTLPHYFPVKGVQREVTAKTSTTMKFLRTSENIIDTQLLLSPQDQTTSSSSDSDQINYFQDEGISDSGNDQNFCDTSF